MWLAFIGALVGAAIVLGVMDLRDGVNATRFSITCQHKTDKLQ